MSLLCAYSDSSSASGSDDEQEHSQETVAVAEDLPSVDDLFSSNGASVLSGSTTVSRLGARPNRNQTQDVNKRRSDTDVHATDVKRLKRIDIGDSSEQTAKPRPRQTKPFAPPQLKRPNVSTEDIGAWNTQTTMKHHERKQRATEERN